jgi:hypothetical protein
MFFLIDGLSDINDFAVVIIVFPLGLKEFQLSRCSPNFGFMDTRRSEYFRPAGGDDWPAAVCRSSISGEDAAGWSKSMWRRLAPRPSPYRRWFRW